MLDDRSSPNPVNSILREFFRPVLDIARQLPAPISYGLVAVLALLVAVLVGADLPGPLVVLMAALLLACLAAFVYTQPRQTGHGAVTSANTQEKSVSLPTPSGSKHGVLVDLSHQQDGWRQGSLFDLPPESKQPARQDHHASRYVPLGHRRDRPSRSVHQPQP